MKEIVRLLKQASASRDTYGVFSDCMEAMAIAISNSVDLAQHEVREKRYMEIVNRYDHDVIEVFPRILGEVALAMNNAPSDILGETFHELELHNKARGQFFTPYDVCRMMAGLAFDNQLELQVAERGYVKALEPACGSGAMVIAMTETMRDRGLDPEQQLHVTAVDVDERVVHMAYVQLSSLGIPAIIYVGDSLTAEMREVWYTPAHVIGDWATKLAAELSEVEQSVTVDPNHVLVKQPVQQNLFGQQDVARETLMNETPSLAELKQTADALRRDFFHAMDLENTHMSYMTDVDDDEPMAQGVAELAAQRLDKFLLENPRLGADVEWAAMYDDAVQAAAVEAEVQKQPEAILADAEHTTITPPQRPVAAQRAEPAMRALHIPADPTQAVTVFKIEGLFDVRELLRADIERTSYDRDAVMYVDANGRNDGARMNYRANDHIFNRSASAKQGRMANAEPGYGLYGDVVMIGESRSGEVTTLPGQIEREFGTYKHQAIEANELRDQLAQNRGHHH